MSIPKIPSNRLYSEADLNYNKLQDILASGDWKNADIETRHLILKASPGGEKGWLHRIDILAIPSTDLETINRLWINYSEGRFGFSIQKHIWLSLGGQIDVYNYEIFKKFSEEVGWFMKPEWLPDYEGKGWLVAML